MARARELMVLSCDAAMLMVIGRQLSRLDGLGLAMVGNLMSAWSASCRWICV